MGAGRHDRDSGGRDAGAIYTGVAITGNGTTHRLDAADFFGGKIDVYPNDFAPTSVPGGFVDASIPAAYGPFNVTAIQGNVYVACAKNGAISAYDSASGAVVGRLRTGAGKPEGIEGLWAIAFGNGVRGQHTDALFFAAGVDETHGVCGRLDADDY